MSDQLFGGDEETGAGPSTPGASAPLAVRMRPRSLEDLVGQEHLLATGSTLRTAIETGEPHSMVLYGPPGTGKTTIARIVATAADGAFEEESAVNAGRAEVREMLGRAAERRRAGRRTVFFLDEIHRFNKAQQDALLPAVEDGLVTLIGATTENPYFEVNSALLSRSQIYELRALGDEDVAELLRRSLSDPGRGIADPPEVDDDALAMLAARAGGDARAALGALERAATAAGTRGHVDIAAAEDALSSARCSTTRAATATTTTSRPGSRRPATPTSTRRSTTWPRCWPAVRTRGSSPGGWSSSPPRTSATPRRRRWRSRPPPVRPSTASGCPSAGSTSPRRPSISRSPRSRTPPTRRCWRPRSGSGATVPRSRRRRSATVTTRARRSSAAGSGIATRTTSPGVSPISGRSRRRSGTPASTSPPAAASKRSSRSG
ncbi:MAG: AAA family ATPase [Solirubrobacterales bacterium]|nr:AAA family ATPase [Solirubrobacterales bacterium]